MAILRSEGGVVRPRRRGNRRRVWHRSEDCGTAVRLAAVRLDVLALEAAIQDRYGQVDVLINNAGIMEQVDSLDRSVGDERIAQEIAVNLTRPILLTPR